MFSDFFSVTFILLKSDISPRLVSCDAFLTFFFENSEDPYQTTSYQHLNHLQGSLYGRPENNPSCYSPESTLVQSTLVISNSKGLSEILRDIRTSTYQIFRIEEKLIRLTTFNKYV